MIKGMRTGAFCAAALLTMLGGAGSAAGATCEAACTDQHTQCTRSGKDYGACMDAWRQCKTTCATPAKAPPAPAPKPMPAVARR